MAQGPVYGDPAQPIAPRVKLTVSTISIPDSRSQIVNWIPDISMPRQMVFVTLRLLMQSNSA
jgi:hypothetical protein